MKSFGTKTWTAFALSMALLAGCQTNRAANDGSGYAHVALQPASRDFLIGNDRNAAETIAGNNRTCARDAQCRK
jgi:hypothetical protein